MAERPRVLVVDDEPDIGRLFQLVLELEGFDPVVVPGGREAIDALQADPLPACVVLDLQMPEVDGWQTLEAIRGQVRTALLPVLLCSVKSHEADRERGWRMGCDAYVTKPFSSEDLLREIRGILTRGPVERTDARVTALEAIERRTG